MNPQIAYDLAALCTGVPGGSRVEIVGEAPYALAVTAEFSPKVNRLVAAHVERSEFVQPSKPEQLGEEVIVRDRRKGMTAALNILASLVSPELGDHIKMRNPESVLSFSVRSPKLVKEIKERYVNSVRMYIAASKPLLCCTYVDG